MAFKGPNHGGHGRSAEEVKSMQLAYVDNRIAGMGIRAAAEAAGYGKVSEVEARNRSAIVAELDSRGMDESWLAEQYTYCLERIKTDVGRSFDGQAYNKALLQVGYLRGHGKGGPSGAPTVAIQQNFSGGKDGHSGKSPESDERARAEELLARVEDLIRRVEEKVGPLGPPEVHEGEIVPDDAAAHSRVVRPCGEGDVPPGRSVP